jgi:hypothetical protein
VNSQGLRDAFALLFLPSGKVRNLGTSSSTYCRHTGFQMTKKLKTASSAPVLVGARRPDHMDAAQALLLASCGGPALN